MGGLLSWNLKNTHTQTSEIATHQARSFFQEILTTRYWNASHGGVYVPISEEVQPNPYLDVPNRDIVTRDGMKLTMINPANMTRQIGKLAKERNNLWFHITSAKPIRPGNSPDEWESSALQQFEEGAQEFSEFIRVTDSSVLFRYMAPLWVEQPCLKCHAKQGYREGDLRGGISVSIKADAILSSQKKHTDNLYVTYLTIWILGMLGLGYFVYRLGNEEIKREEVIFKLKQALDEVNVLSGLLPICASCKKIRDDKGYWNQLEGYICKHSDTKFTHSICPACARELYPDIFEKMNDNKKL